ncbi:DUF3455 domain-containing protein [Granulicella arctica]|uniref:DUF3455 domain-containing protein n=1 Tax=Granulicella arctica TaxID=940613 RepID=UPI0021E01188|nr:DUF3455 domain-containing protein [Granulicella arctica]
MRSFLLLLAAIWALPIAASAQASDATLPQANQQAVLTVQGRGAQIYGCQPIGATFQWVFQAPVARLFDDKNVEVGTHADGPTWTLQDGSSVQGILVTKQPSPDAANIPWLLLKATKPQRAGLLTSVEMIRRSDTKGGIAPTTGCDATHKGDLVRVPYSATYTFYSSKAATK